ncbi:MAG: SIR2 family protein [Fusobacteriaceae bacterium]|nr:SIR2 family protein [Fusobacteriaceae bacterium]
MGDFYCDLIGAPVRARLTERFLDLLKAGGRERGDDYTETVRLKNSLSEVSQTWLDKALGHRADILDLLRGDYAGVRLTDKALLDGIISSGKFSVILTTHYDRFIEEIRDCGETIHRMDPFRFAEAKNDKIRYYKLLGDISSEYEIIVTDQDIKKMKKLSFYKAFYEAARKELQLRPTIFWGVNLLDPDMLDLMDFLLGPVEELNQPIYLVPSVPLVSGSILKLIGKYSMTPVYAKAADVLAHLGPDGLDSAWLSRNTRKITPFEGELYVLEGLESEAYAWYYGPKKELGDSVIQYPEQIEFKEEPHEEQIEPVVNESSPEPITVGANEDPAEPLITSVNTDITAIPEDATLEEIAEMAAGAVVEEPAAEEATSEEIVVAAKETGTDGTEEAASEGFATVTEEEILEEEILEEEITIEEKTAPEEPVPAPLSLDLLAPTLESDLTLEHIGGYLDETENKVLAPEVFKEEIVVIEGRPDAPVLRAEAFAVGSPAPADLAPENPGPEPLISAETALISLVSEEAPESDPPITRLSDLEIYDGGEGPDEPQTIDLPHAAAEAAALAAETEEPLPKTDVPVDDLLPETKELPKTYEEILQLAAEKKIINIEAFQRERYSAEESAGPEAEETPPEPLVYREPRTHILDGDRCGVETNLSKKYASMGLVDFRIESDNLTQVIDSKKIERIGTADIQVGDRIINSAELRLYLRQSNYDVLEIKTREFMLSVGVTQAREGFLTRCGDFYKYQIFSGIKNTRLEDVLKKLQTFFSGVRVQFYIQDYVGDFTSRAVESETYKFDLLLDFLRNYCKITENLNLTKEKNMSEMQNTFYTLSLLSIHENLSEGKTFSGAVSFTIPTDGEIEAGDSLIFEKIHTLRFKGIGYDLKETIALKEPVAPEEISDGILSCRDRKVGISLAKLEKAQEMKPAKSE